MKYLLLFFVSFVTVSVFAQKQTYYLFAYTQKMTKDICGTKEIIKDAEIDLTSDEALTYKKNYLAELKTKYSSQNRYNYTYVELVKPNQAAIFFESKKTYYPKTDGWDCTSTFYGCIITSDIAAAEAKFSALKAEYKKSVFTEIKRWSKPQIASIKAEDVDINWVQTKQGIIVNFTNTRKDMAFTVLIKNLKKSTKPATPNNVLEMTAVEKHTITIQPGQKLTLNLKTADGFNVDAYPVPATKEEESWIDKGKALIRQYLVDPKKGVQQASSSFGVRG